MLSNVLSNNLTVLRIGMSENILNEIVAVLVTRNVDQWDSRAVESALTDAIKIAAEEINTTNLEAFFDDLRSKLIHAVFGCIANDMINGTTAISWSSMLADVLDAPITELSMGNNINASEDFFNARTLQTVSSY